MASNITKNFKAKAGLRMSAGGILSTKQDDSTLFSAPGSDPSSKMALSLASQAQPQDAVAANNSLSNTDRFKMANATGDAYGVDGKMKGVVSVTPGSSAENSMFNEQGSLRQNMTDASNMSRLSRVDSMTGGNGLDMYRNSLSSGRGASARFGLGLRAGGVVDPEQSEVYEIEGPGDGSGVDDETQVNVHGKKINVSKGERFAVFPAKVPAEAIEEFIESQTGEPSATAGGRGLREGMRAMTGAQGSTIDPRELRPEFRSAAQTPVIEPTAKPGAENLRTINAEKAATKAAEAYKPAMNAGSANDALRAAGKLPGTQPVPPVASAATTAPATAVKSAVGTSRLANAARAVGLGSATGGGAAGLSLGKAMADFADSIPSLRGKATASDSNAELAGTPQHQQVQNEERVAADDAWEKRHGKSLGDQHARVTLAGAATPTTGNVDREFGDLEGAMLRQQIDTVTPETTQAAQADAKSMQALRNAPHMVADRAAVGSDGSVMSVGTANVDASQLAAPQGGGYLTGAPDGKGVRKAISLPGGQTYTGADGNPTTRWEDTAAYKDAIARNARMGETVREMERSRHMRSLESTNPSYQKEGLRALTMMNEQDKISAEKGLKAANLEMQRAQLERDLRKDAQTQRNADRTHEAGREDKFKSRVDTLINQMSTVDGKVDGTKAANLQKYAAQIPREIVRDEKTGKAREMDDNEYFDFLLDNFAVDQITGEAGTHLFTPEKDWQGERTQWKKTSPGLSRVLHGSPMQSVAYEDPVSKRVVYASDIEKLSPRQQAIFNSRVNNPR